MDRGKRLVNWIALAVGLVMVIYATADIYLAYLAHSFTYGDLGLTNDYLASLVHHGRPFYVFDMDINHLRINFSPSLLLWMPFYYFFDSQFLLAVLNILSMAGCVLAFLRLTQRVLGSDLDTWGLAATYAFVLVVVARNVFVWNILTATHFEVFYSLVAACLIYTLIAESSLWLIILLSIIAVGVRQDAGFALAFQLAAVAVLPRGMVKDQRQLRQRCLALAGIGFAYTVFVAKLVFPWLGTDETYHASRLWSHYGSSFGAIAWTMLTSPGRVYQDVIDSAAIPLNGSFLWVQWLNPLVALLTNAPGILLYTAVVPEQPLDRKYLYLYNSSFIIVGMLLSVVTGLYMLRLLIRKLSRGQEFHPLIFTGLGAALMVAAAVIPPVGSEYSTRPVVLEHKADEGLRRVAFIKNWLLDQNEGTDAPKELIKEGVRRIAFIEHWLSRCEGIKAVATDLRSVVFLSNRVGKYLPDNYGKADAAFYFEGGDLYTQGSSLRHMSDFLEILQDDQQFKLVASEGGMAYFVKSDRTCRSS